MCVCVCVCVFLFYRLISSFFLPVCTFCLIIYFLSVRVYFAFCFDVFLFVSVVLASPLCFFVCVVAVVVDVVIVAVVVVVVVDVVPHLMLIVFVYICVFERRK